MTPRGAPPVRAWRDDGGFGADIGEIRRVLDHCRPIQHAQIGVGEGLDAHQEIQLAGLDHARGQGRRRDDGGGGAAVGQQMRVVGDGIGGVAGDWDGSDGL
jgi:hypothetical protein